MSRKFLFSEFVEKARTIHGDLYSYDESTYKSTQVPMLITCNRCGRSFSQKPMKHLQGQGCGVCKKKSAGAERTMSYTEFLTRSISAHGARYTYPQEAPADWHGRNSSVDITCSLHGTFRQCASYHVDGSGCPICGYEAVSERLSDTRLSFIEKAVAVHGDFYIYDSVKYARSTDTVVITCPLHGDFEQVAGLHIRGHGCPKCRIESIKDSNRLPYKDILDRFNVVHSGFYTYDESSYIDTNKQIRIHCPLHGWFEQGVKNHLAGHRCPLCAAGNSRPQEELIKLLSGAVKVEPNYSGWSINRKWEIDLYLPDYKIGIEYNGTYNHTAAYSPSNRIPKPASYHRDKTADALRAGIRLFHFWDFSDMDLIQSVIESKLGLSKKLYARKLSVREVSNRDAAAFYAGTHIHGAGGAGFYSIALIDGASIVACMTFKTSAGVLELSRFSCLRHYVVVGGFNRLFSHALPHLRKLGYSTLVSFCDRDIAPSWEDTVYNRYGFKFLCDSGMQLSYYVHRSTGRFESGVYDRHLFQKYKLPSYWPDADMSLTGDAICAAHNVYPIYNSGTWKFSLDF